jgi:hypothetical protein
VLDVLARQLEPSVVVTDEEPRAPWQAHSVSSLDLPSSNGPRRVVPVVIPVIGGRPIRGRHLVRAPWAEPLAAFAGVVVETQLVPDEWLRPRSAARRAVDLPSMLAEGPRLAPATAPLAVARVASAGSSPAANVATAMPSAPYRPVRRVVPVSVGPMAAAPADIVDRATRREIDGLVAIPVVGGAAGSSGAVLRTTAIPSTFDPLVSPPATTRTAAVDPVRIATPSPARRGFLARAMVFTIGLVVSMVAFEAVNRLGHR